MSCVSDFTAVLSPPSRSLGTFCSTHSRILATAGNAERSPLQVSSSVLKTVELTSFAALPRLLQGVDEAGVAEAGEAEPAAVELDAMGGHHCVFGAHHASCKAVATLPRSDTKRSTAWSSFDRCLRGSVSRGSTSGACTLRSKELGELEIQRLLQKEGLEILVLRPSQAKPTRGRSCAGDLLLQTSNLLVGRRMDGDFRKGVEIGLHSTPRVGCMTDEQTANAVSGHEIEPLWSRCRVCAFSMARGADFTCVSRPTLGGPTYRRSGVVRFSRGHREAGELAVDQARRAPFIFRGFLAPDRIAHENRTHVADRLGREVSGRPAHQGAARPGVVQAQRQ